MSEKVFLNAHRNWPTSAHQNWPTLYSYLNDSFLIRSIKRPLCKKKRCLNCRQSFTPRAQCPNQKYCPLSDCQKARKAKWQRDKRRTDPDYKTNQRNAQKKWQNDNPRYWKQWRECNPAYVERNRRLQTHRNLCAKLRAKPSLDVHTEPIAKVDVLNHKNNELSGIYALIPVTRNVCKDGRVNRDFLIQFSQLLKSNGYCKETTL